jgi:hypothetical protein
MQRQKRYPLSARSLRQAISAAALVRPAANNNEPGRPGPTPLSKSRSRIKA